MTGIVRASASKRACVCGVVPAGPILVARVCAVAIDFFRRAWRAAVSRELEWESGGCSLAVGFAVGQGDCSWKEDIWDREIMR